MTDAELVVRAKAGEERAFEELVARPHDACHRLARRLLGNDPDAQDVVQETFVRAYQGMHRYQEQDVFRSWLFRILVNRCRTLQSKNRRRWSWQVSDAAAVASAPATPNTHPAECHDQLKRCLDALDPLTREVVLLADCVRGFGRHAALLDVTDLSVALLDATELSPGICFARLQSSGEARVRRLVIVK